MNKAEAKREVARLVSKLDSLTKHQIKEYNEENTKKDFILPLFRALGWATEDRREVTAEDKVSRRRVDYAFRIDGIPKFFLEAKPLKADLDNPEYAWQAINYAWTKGVTWAVLTDFEGLKVFNAQWKGPNLLYNRFLDIPYTEYIERFDELWLLSRESFDKALLDIEAEKVAKKGKREPVGKQLFDDLITWRQKLYRQLRGWKENKEYSEAEIDEAVQRILDRLIFIRTAEDRELEERVLLPAVREWRENGHRKELDKALVRIFRDFDVKYDSELFEAGHFCEKLACDSNTHASVIEGLYGMRDEVPTYNFDAIDVDVLGGIYEQYLSYRQGPPEKVEEAKRARRKKRGIYYTPKFVVQYIVENTVGRLLQERSHDEIRKLRILDPACGSGSFLIEAFDRLDRYHQEARGTAQRSDEKAAQDDFLERLRILRENIYGVDLDPQAVEIARLNLLLKTLHRRALLPKLEDKIRCGNSLISGMPIELSQYFGADWREKRPFNWEEEFPKVMQDGGFEVVIGNPPYVTEQLLDQERAYYKVKFRESLLGKLNTYRLFLHRGIELLKEGGYLGFIIPNTYLTNRDSTNLRKLILDTCRILTVISLPEAAHLFGGVTQATTILILQRDSDKKQREQNSVKYSLLKSFPSVDSQISYHFLKQGLFNRMPDSMFVLPSLPQYLNIADKMDNAGPELGEIAQVYQGEVNLTIQKGFIFPKKTGEDSLPLIRGNDIDRYSLDLSSSRPKASWVNPAVNVRQHFSRPRIVTQEVSNMQQPRRIKAALAPKNAYCGHSTNYILPKDEQYDLRFVLGLLNSRLLDFYFRLFNNTNHLPARELKRLPIRRIDFDNPQDVKMHDDLVALVERMLDLHKRLKEAVGKEKKDLERQIARTDGQIDDLVYQLYDITEEERKIIEGET